MAYTIAITEVGPDEYPLLEVLRETIFHPFNHVSRVTIAQALEGQADILCLMAHLESNPVGFKIGCRSRPGLYHSRWGGVLPEYRRLGLGRRMQDWQHRFAEARRYERVFFNTFNHFPGMLLFGLRTGFRPVGINWLERDGPSIQMIKDLDQGDGVRFDETLWDGGPHAPAVEIGADDGPSLYQHISNGWQILGMRSGESKEPLVVLSAPNAGPAR
jgi:GNAT superfamily N-acetyltransferase